MLGDDGDGRGRVCDCGSYAFPGGSSSVAGGVVQGSGGQDGAGLVPGVGRLGPAEDGVGAPAGGAGHRPGGGTKDARPVA